MIGRDVRSSVFTWPLSEKVRRSWRSFRRAAGSMLRDSTAPGDASCMRTPMARSRSRICGLGAESGLAAHRTTSGTCGCLPTASTWRRLPRSARCTSGVSTVRMHPSASLSATTVPSSRSRTARRQGRHGRYRSHGPCLESGNGARIVLRGHQDEVNDAVFTSDGSRVLSASADGTLRLWDAQSGDALAVLQSGGGPLWDVTVSRGGKIATLSSAGVVRVFNCEVCGSLDQVRALARSRSARSLSPQERQGSLPGRYTVCPRATLRGRRAENSAACRSCAASINESCKSPAQVNVPTRNRACADSPLFPAALARRP